METSMELDIDEGTHDWNVGSRPEITIFCKDTDGESLRRRRLVRP